MKTSANTSLFLLFFGGLLPAAVFAASSDIRLARSVVKVMAHSADGKNNMGSGVIIAENKVVTNCHVTRNAGQIFLFKAGRRYSAVAQAALPEYDVCLLRARALPFPKVSLATGKKLKIGEAINIYGYPMALGMRVTNGTIVGLYPYSEQEIIEIDAGFTQGASGGGVFNSDGELIGLATFIGKKQDRYHFYAIPAAWLSRVLTTPFRPIKPLTRLSFWESGKFRD